MKSKTAKELIMKETINKLNIATKEARISFINKNVEIEQNNLKNMIKTLEKNNWDLDKIAPYPKSSAISPSNYRFAISIRRHYEQYFQSTQGSRRISEPNIVALKQNAFDKVISEATKKSNASFDSYINKLSIKINSPVKSANLEGNLWQHSFLKVILEDNTIQIWKTQMIINSSVYGKLFNQFPTRLMKK